MPWWLPVLVSIPTIGTALLVVHALHSSVAATGARFPPDDEPLEEEFLGASGMLNGIHYRGLLYVGIGSRGLHLGLTRVARGASRRAVPCYPWSEIVRVRSRPTGWRALLHGTTYGVRGTSVTFDLAGPPARALEHKLEALEAASGE